MDSGRPGVSDEKNAGRNSLKCDLYISGCITFLNPERFSKIVLVFIHFPLSAIHLWFTLMKGKFGKFYGYFIPPPQPIASID